MTRTARPAIDIRPGGFDADQLQGLLGIGFERSTEAMLLIDEALLAIVCANPAARVMLAADKLAGRLLTEFSTSDRSSGTGWESAALATRHRSLDCECELVTDSGIRLMASVRCESIELSDTQFFLLQLREITRERQLLAASELRFAQLAGGLPDASVFMFDRELRLQLVLGEAMGDNGDDPVAMTGKLLSEAFDHNDAALLEVRWRAALAGRASDFDYTSAGGRQLRMRIRPISDTDNVVVGGLAITDDVSDGRVQQLQSEQAHRLDSLGSCWYDRRSGWSFDRELLELWGVDHAETPQAAVADLLLPTDRAATLGQWNTTLTLGGRCHTQYRIRNGRTGQTQHLQSVYEAVVDVDHILIRAVATHFDVTAVVAASESAEVAAISAAGARRELVRRVSNSIATTRMGIDELLLTVAELACAALGATVVLRILAPDQTIDREVIARDAEPARRSYEHGPAISAAGSVPVGIVSEVIALGRSVTTIDVPGRAGDLPRQSGGASGTRASFVVAPVRHDGKVLGLLAVSRDPLARPFQTGDTDLVQGLADRTGAAIAENHALEAAAQGRVERDAVVHELRQLSDDQRELLEQLTGMETRERTMLAEIIHDEPIQLIVAAILRIDLVSARAAGADTDVDELDRIASLLENSVEGLRRLIVTLLPPDLTDGLGVALRELAAGIFVGTGTLFHVVGQVHPNVSVPARAAAYRIFREAMVNARKHAQADNVTLRLVEQGAEYVLTLSDDGIGSASMGIIPGHLGMATMRARANAEGGRLRCESAPGRGAIVELILPMATQPADSARGGAPCGSTSTILEPPEGAA